MPTTKQLLTVSGLTMLTAGMGYCFYFDYKRRNDAAFRRRLQRDQRKVAKAAKANSDRESADAIGMLKTAVDAVNAEPLPESVEGKESLFMEQVGIGEMLAQRLPHGAVPAAIAFFKAYKVYPSPQELIMIYQRTMPQEVFMLVMEMIKIDVNATLRASSASTRMWNGPIIEEIPAPERSQPAVPVTAKPTAFTRTDLSPTQSTAPSEHGSNTGRSFVLVDGDIDAASRVTPVSSSESKSLPKLEQATEDNKSAEDASLASAVEKAKANAADQTGNVSISEEASLESLT